MKNSARRNAGTQTAPYDECYRFILHTIGHIHVREVAIMLKWALFFAVIAVIAGLLGFTGIAAGAAAIAKFLFIVFLILCVVFLVLGFVVTKKIVD
jgi:uncharacterized membrane protein YtjA (UPF0391 family)